MITNNKGTASILVIFMLLVLVTLGALAITSANVNYKLSQRSLSWNVMYYELDAYGEEFLFALDKKIAEAETKALEYIDNKKYQSAAQSELPAELQAAIFSAYTENGYAGIAEKIYMYYADKYVNELSLSYSDLQLYTVANEPFVEKIMITLQIASEREPLNKLYITLWVEPSSEGGLSRVIEDWYEYQETEEETTTTELWDGTIN